MLPKYYFRERNERAEKREGRSKDLLMGEATVIPYSLTASIKVQQWQQVKWEGKGLGLLHED